MLNISNFSRLMWGLHAIDSVQNMEEELKKDDLLRKDVTNQVSLITLYLPYLRFLSGGITVGKHKLKQMSLQVIMKVKLKKCKKSSHFFINFLLTRTVA